jgi:phosphohistidine swiveling domain-containing protein
VNTLLGDGNGAGRAIGRAVRITAAVPAHASLPDELIAEITRRLHRRAEPLEVVLVASAAADAARVGVPGLAVVAVVAEEPAAEASDLPLVAGVDGALALIPDGEWLLVDADRGRVVVGPDAGEIARAQAAPERPRPRVLLGAAHVPARTRGGRTVAVWALVRSADEVRQATEHGADGLVVLVPSELVPASGDDDPDDARTDAAFARVADAIGGGDVAVWAAPGLLDPLALVRLAGRARASWLLRPDDLPLPTGALRDELRALARDEQDADRPAGLPRLVRVVSDEDEDPTDEAVPFDEIIVMNAADADHLAGVLDAAAKTGLAVRARVDADPDVLLPRAVSGGAAGVLVASEQVAAAKDLVRVQE